MPWLSNLDSLCCFENNRPRGPVGSNPIHGVDVKEALNGSSKSGDA